MKVVEFTGGKKTYHQLLLQHLADCDEELLNSHVSDLVIVFNAEGNGLGLVPLTGTDPFLLVGMLEAVKLVVLDIQMSEDS